MEGGGIGEGDDRFWRKLEFVLLLPWLKKFVDDGAPLFPNMPLLLLLKLKLLELLPLNELLLEMLPNKFGD